jgi:tetratricopeptide (TPR) repeat protein
MPVHPEDRWSLAWRGRGAVAFLEEDFETAQACFERSLATAHADGGLRHIAQAIEWLGYLAHERGDLGAARHHLAQAQSVFEEHGAGGLGSIFCRCGLGLVHLDAGEPEPAEALLREALVMLQGDESPPSSRGSGAALGSPGRAFADEPARRTLEGLAGAAAMRLRVGRAEGTGPADPAIARRALRLAGAASALDRRLLYRPRSRNGWLAGSRQPVTCSDRRPGPTGSG